MCSGAFALKSSVAHKKAPCGSPFGPILFNEGQCDASSRVSRHNFWTTTSGAQRHQPAPLSWAMAAIVMGVLSILCWGIVIAAAEAVWQII